MGVDGSFRGMFVSTVGLFVTVPSHVGFLRVKQCKYFSRRACHGGFRGSSFSQFSFGRTVVERRLGNNHGTVTISPSFVPGSNDGAP